MAYWLMSAEEPVQKKVRHVKVQNQSFTGLYREHYEKVMRMEAGNFLITPAATALGGSVDSFLGKDADKKWTTMIHKGITTVLLLMPVTSRRGLEDDGRNLQRQLAPPVDYLLVPSIPSNKLTSTIIHGVILNKYPLIEITFSSYKDCKNVPWDWIRQAVGPSALSFMFRFPPPETIKENRLKEEWEKGLAAEFPVLPLKMGPLLNKKELQFCGLYPKKGSVVRGDADYLLYYKTEQKDGARKQLSVSNRHPDIVVMRGHVLKAGRVCASNNPSGYCCNGVFPGRLRSIDYA
ncbi:hypothetical protein [Salibacterium halotolerans]|uniref:Uncharacterized protein n=1 Tax=Salibacterium halotolerans TaxID=1884432 RepID=A0A1I5Q782_9BACI|nr:hypothetical protein [Salibacterium halotolerans]SFP42133.1 hypothetical protein SAMN05518683_10552 [Salibacterium halotolerans]